jgi:hypothetical protein
MIVVIIITFGRGGAFLGLFGKDNGTFACCRIRAGTGIVFFAASQKKDKGKQNT